MHLDSANNACCIREQLSALFSHEIWIPITFHYGVDTIKRISGARESSVALRSSVWRLNLRVAGSEAPAVGQLTLPAVLNGPGSVPENCARYRYHRIKPEKFFPFFNVSWSVEGRHCQSWAKKWQNTVVLSCLKYHQLSQLCVDKCVPSVIESGLSPK